MREKCCRSYNTNLGELLDVPDDDGRPINPRFLEHEGHIWRSIQLDPVDTKYEGRLDQELLETAAIHIERNRRRRGSNTILVVVHPFFLHLRDFQLYSDEAEAEANTYVKRLLKLLEESQDAGIDVVACEILHDYGALTSSLLEKKLINDVVLTENCRGRPLSDDDLMGFQGMNVALAGGYLDSPHKVRCYGRMARLLHYVAKASTIVGVQGLSMAHPNDNDCMFPVVQIPNIISIEQSVPYQQILAHLQA